MLAGILPELRFAVGSGPVWGWFRRAMQKRWRATAVQDAGANLAAHGGRASVWSAVASAPLSGGQKFSLVRWAAARGKAAVNAPHSRRFAKLDAPRIRASVWSAVASAPLSGGRGLSLDRSHAARANAAVNAPHQTLREVENRVVLKKRLGVRQPLRLRGTPKRRCGATAAGALERHGRGTIFPGARVVPTRSESNHERRLG